MCSFDGADLGTNSDSLVSFPVRSERLWNVCGTFVERLLFYWFDISELYIKYCTVLEKRIKSKV
jgi:hypothetical protein